MKTTSMPNTLNMQTPRQTLIFHETFSFSQAPNFLPIWALACWIYHEPWPRLWFWVALAGSTDTIRLLTLMDSLRVKFKSLINSLFNQNLFFYHCRVSFGSSKGSMVETLIFETPTPLPEHAEREFFSSTNPSNAVTQENGLNDSGIELQEE